MVSSEILRLVVWYNFTNDSEERSTSILYLKYGTALSNGTSVNVYNNIWSYIQGDGVLHRRLKLQTTIIQFRTPHISKRAYVTMVLGMKLWGTKHQFLYSYETTNASPQFYSIF
jgi:hypothetical protein